MTDKAATTREKLIKDGEYKRGLKDRHVQLIALGGIIGSGYFLGTGEIINQVGPAAFLAYIFGGIVVYLIMLCMGELAVAIPISGSFVTYAAEFISPSIACGVGWSYWVSWVSYIPAECIAGGIIMEHFTGINSYIWALAIGSLITYINLRKVGIFGEIEFWLSLIKVVALLAFVIIAVLIFLGIIHGNQPSQIIGTKFILDQGGLFPNGHSALLTAMVLLLVNYQGSEIVGLTAGESVDPSKTIPHAIRNVTLRILFIYIVPVLLLVLIFPWNQAGIDKPVFAEALNMYDLHWAGAITSIVTLTATISCSSSGVYGIVRSLSALAGAGMAPKALGQMSDNSVPRNAILVTLIAVWGMLFFGYFLGKSVIYLSLLLVSGFTGLIAWISICWCQIAFRRKLYKAGYSRKDLKFSTPGSPYTAMLAIIMMLFSLSFLLLHENEAYQLAFSIGCFSFLVPVLIYKIGQLLGYNHGVSVNKLIGFKDIFPNKKM
jgi:AAT family amino acid transporter